MGERPSPGLGGSMAKSRKKTGKPTTGKRPIEQYDHIP